MSLRLMSLLGRARAWWFLRTKTELESRRRDYLHALKVYRMAWAECAKTGEPTPILWELATKYRRAESLYRLALWEEDE
jgi:hypothetical protein